MPCPATKHDEITVSCEELLHLRASGRALSPFDARRYRKMAEQVMSNFPLLGHGLLACLALAQGDEDSVRHHFAIILGIEGVTASNQANYATALAWLGDYEGAAECYENILRLAGEDPTPLEVAARVAFVIGDDARVERALGMLHKRGILLESNMNFTTLIARSPDNAPHMEMALDAAFAHDSIEDASPLFTEIHQLAKEIEGRP